MLTEMQTYMCATSKAAGEKFSGEPSAREGGRPVGAGSVTQALDQTLATFEPAALPAVPLARAPVRTQLDLSARAAGHTAHRY